MLREEYDEVSTLNLIRAEAREDGFKDGEKKGETKGEKKGVILTTLELVRGGDISIHRAWA